MTAPFLRTVYSFAVEEGWSLSAFFLANEKSSRDATRKAEHKARPLVYLQYYSISKRDRIIIFIV